MPILLQNILTAADFCALEELQMIAYGAPIALENCFIDCHTSDYLRMGTI